MTRLQHGLALDAVASAAGVSIACVSRIERGLASTVPVPLLGRLAAAVGLDLSFRLYPSGDPLRDAAHDVVLGRLRVRLHAQLRWAREVPLPRAGDRRAWDAVIRGNGWLAGVEAETRPRDLQALLRRIALKQRDGAVNLVLLVRADTRHNRALVRLHLGDLAEAFPAAPADTLRRLEAGARPAGSSVLLL